MANASVALNSARVYLNDTQKQIWTDAVLIPYLDEAHQELQDKLWTARSQTLRKVSNDINVIANTTILTLPTDLLQPIKLFEKVHGAAISTYTEMTEVFDLPILTTGTSLIYWTWKEDTILFLGSSTNEDVRVIYRKSVALPAAGTDSIGILLGELYIAPRTAAYAAASVGNTTLAMEAIQLSNERLEEVIKANRGQYSLLKTMNPMISKMPVTQNVG